MNSLSQSVAQEAEYDLGLRNFFLSVYQRLTLGLLLTAVMAWVASNDPVKSLLFRTTNHHVVDYTILGWIVAFAPIFVMVGLGVARSMRDAGAIAFWSVAALFGLSMGSIVLRYSGVSIATAFVETAGAFGAMSLFGYTTKRDLSGWGAALFVGLLGILIAIIVSVFLHTTAFMLGINILGILIFAGFTAFDTQMLKSLYRESNGSVNAVYVGALNLYLDFINLFMFLLSMSSGDDD